MAEVINVVICDDSALVRAAVSRILEREPGISVVARVGDGKLAVLEGDRRRGGAQPVDVVVLDLEMPVMDGMTALPLLLGADPSVRVLISSTTTTRGAEAALQALSLGASDYLPKPRASDGASGSRFSEELLAKVHGLTRLRRRTAADPTSSILRPRLARQPPQLLAIGSSTGGPNALFTLVPELQHLPIPLVLTQHMPPMFTPILAEHITRLGVMPCTEAQGGEMLAPGRIYLAPGDRHFLVHAVAGGLRTCLSSGPAENYCRPSVNLMMRSAAAACPGQVLAVMLTGMGRDGLDGARCIVEGGGMALAQDEATSVVWGMPGAVARAGLCHAVLPLAELGAKIRSLVLR